MKIERRRVKSGSRSVAGFTFLETLAAVAIFGVCFGALLEGLTWSVSSVKFARETVRATQIMEEKLDPIRLYSWDQITTPGFITNQFYAPFSPAKCRRSCDKPSRARHQGRGTDRPPCSRWNQREARPLRNGYAYLSSLLCPYA